MQSPETSCILIPGGPQNPQTAWKAAGKERIRVRGIPGGVEAGAHQAPPAPQTAPQRGLGADRSRVGARHLSPAPRPSKRIHNHPHQPRRVTRIPPPSRPKTRRRLPRKEPRPQRIQTPAITTRPPRPSPRTDRRSLPLHPPNQTDDPTPRPTPVTNADWLLGVDPPRRTLPASSASRRQPLGTSHQSPDAANSVDATQSSRQPSVVAVSS
jgi:hypothetical protein